MQVRKCTKCGEYRVKEEFYRENNRKDGRKAECKPCTRERRRERYYDRKGKKWRKPLTKRCRTCGYALPRVEFYENPANRDGMQSDCKACLLEYSRERHRFRKLPHDELAREATRLHHRLMKERARKNPAKRWFHSLASMVKGVMM